MPLINDDINDLLDRLYKPKTVKELNEEVDMSIATIYRKLDELVELDLVEVDEGIPQTYMRKIGSYKIEFDNNREYLENQRNREYYQ